MQVEQQLTRQQRRSKERAAAKVAARKRRELERRSPLDRTVLRDPKYHYHDERDVVTGRVYAVADDYTTKTEILADAYGDGLHYRPWASKKGASRALAAVYFRLADQADERGDEKGAAEWRKRAMATSSCASVLDFKVSYTNDGDEMRLGSAKFCHDPLCPMCLWRRSIRNTAELTATIDRIMGDGEPVRFLLLTLTVPNCAPEVARETINAMHAAFGRMTKSPWWNDRILGYMRKTEWTWSTNPAMKETPFNAHMHVLLVVPASYFERSEAWRINLHRLFREVRYNPKKNAGACRSLDSADHNVRVAIARAVLAEAEADGVAPDNGPLWRTKYRKRFQRIMERVENIAAQHTTDWYLMDAIEYADAHGIDAGSLLDEANNKARRDFVEVISAAADVVWMDQEDWLIRWRDAMRDQSIMDVHITAVKHNNGQPVREYDSVGMKMAVKEVCKYTQKSTDYILPKDPQESERRVAILRGQLTGLRMLSYGGIMADVHAAVLDEWKKARKDKSEDADNELIYTSGKDDGIDADECIIAHWEREIRAYAVTRVPESEDAWRRWEEEHRRVPPSWDTLTNDLQSDIWKQIALYAIRREMELRKQDDWPKHHFTWVIDDLGYPVAVSDTGERIGGAMWAVRIGYVVMIEHTENAA